MKSLELWQSINADKQWKEWLNKKGNDGTLIDTDDNVSFIDTETKKAVKITYEPSQISYGQLLKIYFLIAHDPTQLNRQGPDWGAQYRSVIFFANNEQKRVAQAYIAQLNKAHSFRKPIVTQLVPLNSFYAAEEYHQQFIDRNPNYPYVVVHDLPKLAQLQKQFPDMYKKG